MNFPKSEMGPVMFIGGLTGACAGFLMQYWANTYGYSLNVGGRPYFSWPSFIPITFEMMVLTTALTGCSGSWRVGCLVHHGCRTVPVLSTCTRCSSLSRCCRRRRRWRRLGRAARVADRELLLVDVVMSDQLDEQMLSEAITWPWPSPRIVTLLILILQKLIVSGIELYNPGHYVYSYFHEAGGERGLLRWSSAASAICATMTKPVMTVPRSARKPPPGLNLCHQLSWTPQERSDAASSPKAFGVLLAATRSASAGS